MLLVSITFCVDKKRYLGLNSFSNDPQQLMLVHIILHKLMLDPYRTIFLQMMMMVTTGLYTE